MNKYLTAFLVYSVLSAILLIIIDFANQYFGINPNHFVRFVELLISMSAINLVIIFIKKYSSKNV
ncbi:hypothetical protein SAMN02745245_01590 [Anaerosphaera aminiphila DSM 21120]|uniref:Uncharacterized protein n=1 Tax=Anaerosphaera aminiphila DSM 21120 TaxID=1120995 RepID=A0A1M5TWA0_9FIRM|nr:hypothetical protein [Anaerosphaera aminiphila]SHH54890.1 hypothetical protein SAMN02745245_01590 [Anaerosphaera aminiphila DSM 21120]